MRDSRQSEGAALLELAERCEQAKGPDYLLDREINAATVNFTQVSRYTASLDAAMTLANGYGGQVTFFKDGTGKAFLWQPYPMAVEAKAATPALALCASALRARAQTQSVSPLSNEENES